MSCSNYQIKQFLYAHKFAEVMLQTCFLLSIRNIIIHLTNTFFLFFYFYILLGVMRNRHGKWKEHLVKMQNIRSKNLQAENINIENYKISYFLISQMRNKINFYK